MEKELQAHCSPDLKKLGALHVIGAIRNARPAVAGKAMRHLYFPPARSGADAVPTGAKVGLMTLEGSVFAEALVTVPKPVPKPQKESSGESSCKQGSKKRAQKRRGGKGGSAISAGRHRRAALSRLATRRRTRAVGGALPRPRRARRTARPPKRCGGHHMLRQKRSMYRLRRCRRMASC